MNIAIFFDKAPRYILYGLLLLMPVFFLPATSYPVDLNKQTLFAVAVFCIALLLIANALRAGSVRVRSHLLFLPVLLLVVVAGISAYGSGAITHSFWGSQVEADSLFNFILLALFCFLTASLCEENAHVENALLFFIGGAVLASLFIFVHYVSPAFLPWEIARNATFNPFGSLYAFSIYAGGALTAALALLPSKIQKASKSNKKNVTAKKARIITPSILLLGLASLTLFFIEIAINFPVAWVVLAAGSLIVVYFFAHEFRQGNMGFIALPLVVLACSFTLLFIKEIPFVGFVKAPIEVRLTHQATFHILKQTLRASSKNLLFGSGPATFVNQYNLYRDQAVNNGPFWNTHFTQGTGVLLSFFATMGLVGGGLLFFSFCLFAFLGIKWLLISRAKGKEEDRQSFISLAVVGAGIYFLLAWLLYSAQSSLLFGGFLMFALWAALQGKKREIRFVKSPQGTFWGMSGGVILLVVLIFSFYTIGKNYDAELSFARGAVYANSGDLERAMPFLGKAAELNPLDRYWRNLSNARLLYIGALLRNSSLSSDQKRDLVQQNMLISESLAKEAIKINPNNVDNILQIADFYASVMPISEGAFDFAVQNYTRAKNFDPENPSIPAKLGFVYLTRVEVLKTKDAGASYKDALEKARKEGEVALKLKADFAPAKALIQRIQQLQ